MAYVTNKGQKQCAVVDGQPGTEYDGIGSLIFSTDGAHVAYKAQRGEKQLVVVDGQPGAAWDAIGIACRKIGERRRNGSTSYWLTPAFIDGKLRVNS